MGTDKLVQTQIPGRGCVVTGLEEGKVGILQGNLNSDNKRDE